MNRKAESFTFRVGYDAGLVLAEVAQAMFEGKPVAMRDYMEGMQEGLQDGKDQVLRGNARKRGKWVAK